MPSIFYKNNFEEHETDFCSKFENELRTTPASATKIRQEQTKENKSQINKKPKFCTDSKQ